MEEKTAYVSEPLALTDEHYQKKMQFESDEDSDEYGRGNLVRRSLNSP